MRERRSSYLKFVQKFEAKKCKERRTQDVKVDKLFCSYLFLFWSSARVHVQADVGQVSPSREGSGGGGDAASAHCAPNESDL